MRTLVFRVRKCYFEAILAGDKKVEYRKDSEYWRERVPEEARFPLDLTADPWIAVFVSGQRVHRRQIIRIERLPRPANFSEQGKKDVPTPTCIAFFLGEEASLVKK